MTADRSNELAQELERLRDENVPLGGLLDAYGLAWRVTKPVAKTRVRVIDFVDASHPALLRMWDKRRRGYQAMGYRIPSAESDAHLAFDGQTDDAD